MKPFKTVVAYIKYKKDTKDKQKQKTAQRRDYNNEALPFCFLSLESLRGLGCNNAFLRIGLQKFQSIPPLLVVRCFLAFSNQSIGTTHYSTDVL